MTIASATSRNNYIGANNLATYSYSFKINASTDLLLTKRDLSGVETTLLLTNDYTVTGVGHSSGGTITLTAGNLPTGYTLSIRRVVALTQITDIRNQGPYFAEIHEDEFDDLVMIDQQQQDEIDRSFKLSESVSPSTFSPTLPSNLVGQASLTMITNPSGTGFVAGPSAAQISAAATNAASAAASAAAAAASASISNKINVFNVKNYSATGDGSTDDLVFIQNAINALQSAGGGVLYFPPGNYKVSAKLTIANVSFFKIMGDQATLKPNHNDIALDISGTGLAPITDIRLENMRFIQLSTNSTSGGQQAIQFRHTRRTVIDNCYFQDFAVGVKWNDNCQYSWGMNSHFKNIGAGGSGSGGICFYSEGEDGGVGYDNHHVYLLNNHCDGTIYGMETKFCTDVIIAHNIVENTTLDRYGILASSDTGTGQTGTQRVIIHGNIIRNATTDGIFTKGVNIVVSNNVIHGAGGIGLHCTGMSHVISNNIVYNAVVGASFVFDHGASSIGGGIDAAFDTARFQILNNQFFVTTASPCINFNAISSSTIKDNVIHSASGSGTSYGFRFQTCADSMVKDNYVYGGTSTFGFRIESDCSDLLWENNRTVGSPANADVSIPGDFSGTFYEKSSFLSERVVGVIQTTDGTQTVAYAKTLTTNSLYYYEGTAICKNDATSNRAAYKFSGIVYRASSTATLEGNTVATVNETDSGLDATVTVSSNDFQVKVTGLSSQNMHWNVFVEFKKREI